MPRFLVVDDEPVTVEGVSRLLIEDGHEVSPFTHGADAVEALSGGSYDVVLTDLDMPEVDGHAVVRTARARQPHACVVVVTGRAEEERDALAEAGACIVADKPIDYDAITRAVEECHLSGGRAGRGTCPARGDEPEPLVPLRRR